VYEIISSINFRESAVRTQKLSSILLRRFAFLERHVANQQPKNIYVKLEKNLKEITILHFFLFIIFETQLSELKRTKNRSRTGREPVENSLVTFQLLCNVLYETQTLTDSEICLLTNPDISPTTCLPLVLQLKESDKVKMTLLGWSSQGTIMTFSCVQGAYFAEGGTTRTLVCINGVWPTIIPRCTGQSINQSVNF